MARQLLTLPIKAHHAGAPEFLIRRVKGMDGDDVKNEGYLEFNAYRLDRMDGMIHSELRALQSYWEELRAGRSTPMRSDIDPRDMECDARNLFILEN
ncbi:MAG: PAS domain-containing protein, partial [Pseudomonadota bacterium]